MFSQTNNTHPAGLPKESKQEYFERVMIPHLNAAYNLARWMTRNEHDADDVVQERIYGLSRRLTVSGLTAMVVLGSSLLYEIRV
jgi:hypothetical protein